MTGVVAPTLRSAAYVLGGLPLGMAVLVLLPLGAGLGVGLMPVLVGFPIAALTVLGWRALARAERRRAALVLGAPIAEPPARRPAHPGLGARWSARLRDGATWRDLAWVVLLATLGFATALALCVLLAGAVTLLVLPAFAPAAPEGSVLADWPLPGLAPVAGVLALLLAGGGARLFGAGLGVLARGLLAPGEDAELAARVATLETTRAGAVESADATLRRLERDLHDGAQHRLAYVAMELGRARAKFDEDPDAARGLVERAHEESKRAMGELRDLVRGVHPSVLTDRGLAAAVPGLAARSPVPVRTRVAAEPRPGRACETAAYFVIAEALTNVARHARATRASVDVERAGERLVVTVADDGAGGARAGTGGGLAGLAQRVEALDGTLSVDSPAGAGTTIRAELPCGS
jgi:signal transduction histidine kinase